MATLDMLLRQSTKTLVLYGLRKKLGKWLIQKYSLVIAHLEKTFSCMTTSVKDLEASIRFCFCHFGQQ